MKTCTLVGIGGPSGSGKSMLAHALQSHLEATVISVDAYYRPLDHLPLAERHKCNFDHPDSIDWNSDRSSPSSPSRPPASRPVPASL